MILATLQNNPIIGVIFSFFSSYLLVIEQMQSVFAFLGVFTGLLIGIVTLILKLLELRERWKKNK